MLLDSTALLNRKHLQRGDGAWQFAYPAPSELLLHDDVIVYEHGAAPADARTVRASADADAGATSVGGSGGGDARGVVVVTYGNGVPKALEAQRASGEAFDVIDCPLLSRPPRALFDALRGHYTSLLLVDPCRPGAGPLAHFVPPLQVC